MKNKQNSHDLYDRAERKIRHSPKLAPHLTFILADWNEGDEHLRWVIRSTVKEILDWVESNGRTE